MYIIVSYIILYRYRMHRSAATMCLPILSIITFVYIVLSVIYTQYLIPHRICALPCHAYLIASLDTYILSVHTSSPSGL